jgi:(1->4)-alpha-D-glucan 1-alpha-D-glucosylmutase
MAILPTCGWCSRWAQHGADIVGLNRHTPSSHKPENASPYNPSSLLFLKSLYLDPERIDDFRECGEARDLVYSSEFQARLRAQRAVELVDYRAVAAAKMPVLELLYASFRERHLALSTARSRELLSGRRRSSPAATRPVRSAAGAFLPPGPRHVGLVALASSLPRPRLS